MFPPIAHIAQTNGARKVRARLIYAPPVTLLDLMYNSAKRWSEAYTILLMLATVFPFLIYAVISHKYRLSLHVLWHKVLWRHFVITLVLFCVILKLFLY